MALRTILRTKTRIHRTLEAGYAGVEVREADDLVRTRGSGGWSDKGSRPHQVLANSAVFKVEEWLRQDCDDAKVEVRTNGASYAVGKDRVVEPDRLVISRGLRLVVQVAYKHSAAREGANAYLLAALADLGPDCVLVVAHSTSHMQAIARQIDQQLAQRDGHPERQNRVKNKVHVTSIDEVLSERFDFSFLKRLCS